MMDELIRYHMLLEFHSFLHDLANYESEFSRKKDFTKEDSFIRDLVDSTWKSLSSVMKSDLNLLFRDTVLVSHTMVSPSVLGTARNYRQFREKLALMNADEYIGLFILSASDLESFDGSQDEWIERIEEQFRQMETGDTIIESYRELKKYPEQTMERIRNFLDRFYFEFFEKAEGAIETFLKEQTARHRAILAEHPDRFLDEIVRVSFQDMEGKDTEYRYYVGCLNIGRQTYQKEGNRVFCHYNYRDSGNFDPSRLYSKALELFKTLSDETRLKMLRMMGGKSWYSSEMAESLGLNKATVSYHMKSFTRFGIADVRLGENKRIYFSLNKKKLKDFLDRFVEDL